MSTKQDISKENSVFEPRDLEDAFRMAEPEVHVFGSSLVCSTDSRGHATPKNRSPLEIVVDASEGFIPLWGKNLNLRWRFNENSMAYFQHPEFAKNSIRELLAAALRALIEITLPSSFADGARSSIRL